MNRIIMQMNGCAAAAAVLGLLFLNSCKTVPAQEEEPYPVPPPAVMSEPPGTLSPPPVPLPMDTPL